MEQQSIHIAKILFRGSYQILRQPLPIEDLSDHKVTGGKMARIKFHKCPRCDGNIGHIFREVDGWLWFCETKQCLTEDVKHQPKVILKSDIEISKTTANGFKPHEH